VQNVKVVAPGSSGSALTPDSPQGPTDSETLFKRHARFVASFLYRLGVRGPDIDDAVQEVFLAAHRRGGYRPGVASPTTFLARLALEANLSRRRRQGRWETARSEEVARAALGRSPADPAQAFVARQAAERLQASLDAMDAPHRAVFILFELEGESSESIAAGLSIPVGTVHSRLHAARRAFRTSAARSGLRDEGGPDPRFHERENHVMVAREPT
jgi:RNA polymerase sigma-70 factor (ECF subfamily)